MATLNVVYKIGADISGMERKLKKAGTSFEKLGRTVERQGKSIGTALTAGVTLPLLAIGAAAIKSSTDFNRSMSEIATLIPNSIGRVRDLKEEVQAMAIAHGKPVQDLAAGLYGTISAFGDDATQTVGRLNAASRVATAGMSTTTEAVNLLSLMTKAYGDTSAEAVAHAGDLLFTTVRLGQTTFPELSAAMGRSIPIAAELGIEQAELAAVFATLTGVTGNTAEVSTQFAAIQRSLLKQTPGMTAALGKLGLTSGAALIETHGLVGGLEALRGTTDGSREAVTKMFEGAEALGAVFALTGSQADTFSSKFGEMQNVAGATDQAFKDVTEGINATGFTMDQMKEEALAVVRAFGDALLPSLRDLLPVFQSLLTNVTDAVKWFADLEPSTQKLGIAFLALAAALGPAVFLLSSLAGNAGAALSFAASLFRVGAGGTAAAAGVNLTTGAMVGLKAASVGLGTIGLILGSVAFAWKDISDRAAELEARLKDIDFTPLDKDAAAAAVSAAELADKARDLIKAGGSMQEGMSVAVTGFEKLKTATDDVGPSIVALSDDVIELRDALSGAGVIQKAKDLTAAWGALDPATRETAISINLMATEIDALRAAGVQVTPEMDKITAAAWALQEPAKRLADLLRDGKVAVADFKDGVTDASVVMSVTRITMLDLASLIEGKFISATDAARTGLEGIALGAAKAKDGVKDLGSALSQLDLGGLIVGAFQGGGDIGATIGAGIGGAIGSDLASSLISETTGKLGKALGSFLGPLGSLAGGLIGKGIGKLFGGVSEAEQAGRQTAAGFRGAVIDGLTDGQIQEAFNAGWDNPQAAMFLIGLRDAFNEYGVSAAEAERLTNALWAAEREGPEAVQAVIAEINNVTDGMFSLADISNAKFAEMEAAAGRYGISLDDLGPAFQNAKLSATANQIIADFELLVAGGADVNAVLAGMGDETSELISQYAKFGIEVPAAMRPLVEQLFAAGELVDENGVAITDMEAAGIKFAETFTEGFDRVVDSLGELISLLSGPGGVGAVLDGIEDKTIKVDFDVADFPPMPEGVQVSATSPVLMSAGSHGIQDFGRGTLAMLHGREAVVPAASFTQGPGQQVDEALRQEISALRRDLTGQLPDAISTALRSAIQQGLVNT